MKKKKTPIFFELVIETNIDNNVLNENGRIILHSKILNPKDIQNYTFEWKILSPNNFTSISYLQSSSNLESKLLIYGYKEELIPANKNFEIQAIAM